MVCRQVAGGGVLSFMMTYLNEDDAKKAVLLNGTQLGAREMQVALVPGGGALPGLLDPHARTHARTLHYCTAS